MSGRKIVILLFISCSIAQGWSFPIRSPVEENGADFPGRGPDGEDDMILTPEQLQEFLGTGPESVSRSGQRDLKYRWPEGKVYYEISSAFSTKERGVILQAMSHIAEKTCVQFFHKTSDTVDYVNIAREKNTCSAQVGRVGGKQRLNLGASCMTMGVVAHELVHAVGFWHEQSRYDRDDWVSINWSNIPADKQHNFNKYTSSKVDIFGLPYDFKSLMHYGGYDFAADRSKPAIIPKNSGIASKELGNRSGLTQWDAEKINRMYKGIC